jgi:AAA15 family ATPase/GTPase
MIIEFTVKNFRSFKDEATLSLEAEGLRSSKVDVIKTDAGNLLPAVGVFGPNASGKSNLTKALMFMQRAVRNTDTLNNPTTQDGRLRPFLLDKASAADPSFFQVVLWDDEEKAEYRYGFTINNKSVVSEWLDVSAKDAVQRRRRSIFIREGQNFDIHRLMAKELRPRAEQVSETGLALATFAQLNSPLALRIVSLLGEPNLIIYDGATEMNLIRALERCRTDVAFKKRVISFLQQADLGIRELAINEVSIPADAFKKFPASVRKFIKENADDYDFDKTYLFFTAHRLHGKSDKEDNNLVAFNLQEDESLGTQRFLVLACLLFEALEKGAIFVLDELGASLHPFLTREIVNLFQNNKTNPNMAQLIFCSHETYLLSKHSEMRRDQIWFTEKNDKEESSLRSLAEYKTRNDFEVAKNYLEGALGAVPVTRFPER